MRERPWRWVVIFQGLGFRRGKDWGWNLTPLAEKCAEAGDGVELCVVGQVREVLKGTS